MLRTATAADIKNYADEWYKLATDKTRSGYPSYCNGFKTKADLIAELERFSADGDKRALVFESDGRPEGVICFFYIAQDKYLQTVMFNIGRGTKAALNEFAELVQKNFRGYTLYMGFHAENTEATEWLKENAFDLTDHSFDTVKTPRPLGDRSAAARGATRISLDRFSDFRKLHCRCDGDMYWTCERIERDFDNWEIYLTYDGAGAPSGAAYATCGEIFGIDYKDDVFDEEICTSLLTALTDGAERKGPVIYFCEPNELGAVIKAGFEKKGEYVLFEKRL